LINDLHFELPYIKYVDDATVASVSRDPDNPALQGAADYLVNCCNINGMLINTKKKQKKCYFISVVLYLREKFPYFICMTLVLSVCNHSNYLVFILALILAGLLMLRFLLKKVSKRFYILYQLVRAGVSAKDIIAVYCSVIRSILEYACPVLERVQKRCFKIIWPNLSYSDALSVSGVERLSVRRENLVRSVFNEIKQPTHVLNHLLPLKNSDATITNTRDTYPFRTPRCRTERFSRSFIVYCLKKRY
jgi:hypothetical protein